MRRWLEKLQDKLDCVVLVAASEEESEPRAGTLGRAGVPRRDCLDLRVARVDSPTQTREFTGEESTRRNVYA